MSNKFKPALIGGVVLGLLSAIPFVNWANFCCCLWAVLGGLLASYLYIRNSPTPASAGDGALVGVFAGLIGAAIYLVVGIPLSLLTGPVVAAVMSSLVSNIDRSTAEMIMQRQAQTVASVFSIIIQGLISALILFVFTILGGLLGIPLFEKRKGAPPPPPTDMGGGAAGGFAA